ncbi:antitoxin [Cardiobacterium valvarum]|uniref:Uncharacterized protein n=2 Tax=Cardiobacterium valvarum TaxID=194702 RepID=A0A381EEP5_9GAMM|nr:Uncharacterised protein [Cardiobacterium valvarum]
MTMNDEYDFSRTRRNPYTAQLKQAVIIPLDADSAACFQTLAEELHTTTEALIHQYLQDCVKQQRKPQHHWT